jgi:hypothetical protein
VIPSPGKPATTRVPASGPVGLRDWPCRPPLVRLPAGHRTVFLFPDRHELLRSDRPGIVERKYPCSRAAPQLGHNAGTSKWSGMMSPGSKGMEGLSMALSIAVTPESAGKSISATGPSAVMSSS